MKYKNHKAHLAKFWRYVYIGAWVARIIASVIIIIFVYMLITKTP